MKQIRIISLLTAAAMSCIFTAAAFASPIDSAVYNTGTDTITVRGNVCYTEPEASLGNVLRNSSCDASSYTKEDGTTGYAWVNANGNQENITVKDEGENKYLCYSNRTAYYQGIKQNIYTQLKEYGKGKYRISGKVKADDKTITAKDTSGNTKDFIAESGTVYVYIILKNNLYSISVKNVTKDWCEFSADIDVDKFGYEDSSKTTELSDWDENSFLEFRTSNLTFTEEEVKYTAGDIRDISIDDVMMEPVRERGPYAEEDARIAIEDAEGNTVYVNEIRTDANGDYAAALQLPDGTPADGLKAKVSGEHTEGVYEVDVTKAYVDTDIYVSDVNGKIRVEFDIFDLFDSSGYAQTDAVAASYTTAGELADVQILPVNIDLDTDVTQYIDVDYAEESGGFVRIFVFNSLQEMIPLCSIPQKAVTAVQ